MGILEEKIYGTISEMYAKEDEELFKLINSSVGIEKRDLGVTESFINLDLTQAIKVFQTLEDALTPLDKLYVLGQTIHSINLEAQKGFETIGSDDLLPILVFIVIHSDLKSLHSNFLFIENFLFFDLDTNEIG